jgi:cytochrome c oxidase assembly protein subunit 15
MRKRLVVTPEQFRLVAWAGLIALTLIVFTGAAVRLTDSGLGCATWPRCDAHHLTPPDQIHALVEFSNRVASGLVGVVTVLVLAAACLRRPFRRDLAILAFLLPLGVVAQAVLGGYTVREKLAPGFVMSHFGLSMVILIAALALLWRTYYPAGARPRAASRWLVYMVRFTVLLGAFTIFAGTASTAAGPHSGGLVDQHVRRLHFKGADTLVWTIHQHATIGILFGLAAIVAWLLKRREFGTLEPTEPVTVLGILIAGQGLVGAVQYEMKLPAEMVWVHVALATVTWVVALWAWADIGAPAVRRARPHTPGLEPGQAERADELEVVRF